MTNLVSFLMPTRMGSHEMLSNAVRSIVENSGGNEDFEILLRMDTDDKPRHHLADGLARKYGGIKSVIGDRGNGYTDMGVFVRDLVGIANSKWCWLFDDDAWVEGNWYEPLSAVKCDPDHGPAINAENYILGASWYKNGARGGPVGLIMPTEWCRKIHHTNPVDQQWMNWVHQNGWYVRQLANVDYHHDGRRR